MCLVEKPEPSMASNGRRADGSVRRVNLCNTCKTKAHRKRSSATQQSRKGQKTRRLYRLSDSDWARLIIAQDSLCALCGKPERQLSSRGVVIELAVDHDHGCCPGKRSCGKCIRGALCSHCNKQLGWVEAIGLDLIAGYLARPRFEPLYPLGETHAGE